MDNDIILYALTIEHPHTKTRRWMCWDGMWHWTPDSKQKGIFTQASVAHVLALYAAMCHQRGETMPVFTIRVIARMAPYTYHFYLRTDTFPLQLDIDVVEHNTYVYAYTHPEDYYAA